MIRGFSRTVTRLIYQALLQAHCNVDLIYAEASADLRSFYDKMFEDQFGLPNSSGSVPEITTIVGFLLLQFIWKSLHTNSTVGFRTDEG